MEQENVNLKMRNNLLDKITEIYIFAIIILFPLCVDSTGFFAILECKYRVHLLMCLTYISVCILTLAYFLIFKKVSIIKNIKLSKIHYAVLAFWLINIVSCFASPYFSKYNLFMGIGRGEGLINISLYCLSFLFVSLFGRFRTRYITYFSISSICLNTIAILQYVGFNPFNMYQNGIGTHNVSFMTTIGNIDFISAIYCILLTVSFTAFVFLDEKRIYKAIHLISLFMGAFIFIIINVMSGRVAFLVLFTLLFPIIITNSKRLYRTLIVGAMIILGLAINIIINPQYHFDIQKLTLDFQINWIAIALLVITAVFLVLSRFLKKYEYDLLKNKKLIKMLYIIIALCVIIAVAGIYFINFSSGMLGEIHEILHGNFDDTYGTYRVFLWKRAILLLNENTLIGSGPDTFAARFMEKYTEDVKALGEFSINDTAANVYITMLVNIGIIGLLTYLACIYLQIKDGTKRRNGHSMIFLTALICFWIQDLFNLWVVIITPIYWVLMAIHYLSLNRDFKLLESGEKENESKDEKC